MKNEKMKSPERDKFFNFLILHFILPRNYLHLEIRGEMR